MERITPDCFKYDSPGLTWYHYLYTLHDHVANNPESTKWEVVHLHQDGSVPEIAFTLTPTDDAENFQVNFRNDPVAQDMKMAVDPGENITDPLNPSAPTTASPEGQAGVTNPQNRGYSTTLLIREWDDAIGFITKDEDDKGINDVPVGGRVYQPIFADDLYRGLTGLGWYGGYPQDIGGDWTEDSNGNPAHQFQIPGGWTDITTRQLTGGDGFTAWDPKTPAMYLIGDNGNNGRHIGILRYWFNWDDQHGTGTSLSMMRTTEGDGFLHVRHNDNSYNLITAWDPNVSPV